MYVCVRETDGLPQHSPWQDGAVSKGPGTPEGCPSVSPSGRSPTLTTPPGLARRHPGQKAPRVIRGPASSSLAHVAQVWLPDGGDGKWSQSVLRTCQCHSLCAFTGSKDVENPMGNSQGHPFLGFINHLWTKMHRLLSSWKMGHRFTSDSAK